MDELEKTLQVALSQTGKFDAGKAETLRKEIVKMFDKNLKTVTIIFWVFLVISTAMLIAGLIALSCQTGTRGMMFAAVIALIGYESTVLMKLWYWVVNTKLNLLKEIKQLQLQIAELTGKKPSSEN